jgi:hypothetical protein
MKTFRVYLAFETSCRYDIKAGDRDDALIVAERLWMDGVAGEWEDDMPNRDNDRDYVEEA